MDPAIGTAPPEAAPDAAGTGGSTGGSAVSRPATLQDIAEAEAQKQGVDPRLVHAVITTESSYNPNAHNASGAHGLMQLMPATAAKWKVNAADPVENIRGGVSELKALLDAHHGDVVLALRRYNGSPHASEAATQPYVDKVLGQLQPRQPETPGEGAPPTPGQPRIVPSPAPGGGGRGQGPGTGGPPQQPTSTSAVPGTPPPPVPESWTDWAIRHGKSALATIDPRTPEGRQNLAAGAGAAGATALVAATAPVSLPASALTLAGAGILGAAGGGMAAEGGEQLAGTKPPSEGAVVTAGGTQAATEAVGHGLMWPVQAIGRRMIAGRVGRAAAEGISAAKTLTLNKLQSALDTAQTSLRRTKATTKEANAQAATSTRQLVTDAAGRAKQGVAAATAQGADEATVAADLAEHGVQKAQSAAEANTAAATVPYQQVVGAPPPSAAAAGRAANTVIQEGGAAQARTLAGKAVDEAAASGPAVDITKLKAQAQKIVEGQIRPPETSFPRRSATDLADTEAEGLAAAAGMSKADYLSAAAKAEANPTSAQAIGFNKIRDSAREFVTSAAPEHLSPTQAALSEAQGEAGKETLKHPAMAVLQRILNAGDTVPFKDAHLWKVELDNAIRNTRDASVKSQVAALTQTFTGGLRQALRDAGHAPYEAATAAYAKLAPLYTKGMAPQLRKVAVENPEAIVSMLNPAQPTKAHMLVDLLTHQAAAGGDAAGGRAALEAVQSAWVRKKVIDGGLDKLGARLEKIPPEFRQAFLGDPKAQAVLDHLKLIHTAYQTAIATGERGVQAATASGKAGVEAAAALGAERVGAARQAGQATVQAARDTRAGLLAQTRQAGAAQVEQAATAVGPARQALKAGQKDFKAQEAALAGSSLGPAIKAGAGERSAADVLRAMALGPHSIWGGLSIARILHGPTANDLVHWAAASPAGTRMFVTAVTSSAPAAALVDLARVSGVVTAAQGMRGNAQQEPVSPGAGQPPPRATAPPPTVGTPPPS